MIYVYIDVINKMQSKWRVSRSTKMNLYVYT